MLYFCHLVRNVVKTTSGLSILMHGVISLTDGTSYDKKNFCIIMIEVQVSQCLGIWALPQKKCLWGF